MMEQETTARAAHNNPNPIAIASSYDAFKQAQSLSLTMNRGNNMNMNNSSSNYHHDNNNRNGGGNNFAQQRSAAPQQPLVQKLAGAIQNLRRDRDMEYRAKAEAEERLRLAEEEQQALAKIVADLKAKHEKIVQSKERVQASLGPLETEVNDLQEKNQFQHNELLGARAKIQQKTYEMEETARERQVNLQAIRQLAHQHRLKVNAMEQQKVQGIRELVASSSSNKTTMCTDSRAKEEAATLKMQKEGLERELNCLMFEWESFPKLMEEKGRLYLAEAKRVAELNDEMAQELARRGIAVPDGDQVMADAPTGMGGSRSSDITA